MPTPRPDDEIRAEWMERCIPEVIQDGSAENTDHAVAMCSQMWDDAQKERMGMPHQVLNFPLELKQIGEREFEGYGSTFGNTDLGGDIVTPGAFKRSLAAHRKAGTMPLMFWMHDPTMVPGVWKDMREDENGLFVKGELVDTQLGNETRTLLTKKAVRGLSIGFATKDIDFDNDGNRLLKEIELWEVSVVSLAMNPLAQIAAAKARLSSRGEYVPTPREFEERLRAAGCSHKVAAKISAMARSAQPSGGAPDEDDDIGSIAARAREIAGGLFAGSLEESVRRFR